MPDTVRLLSLSYSVEQDPGPLPITPTIQDGQLALTPPLHTPKQQDSWHYVRTPMPSVSAASSSRGSSSTVTYRPDHISVHCLFYYEDGGKLRRKLIVSDLSSQLSVQQAIRRLASYCSSLTRLNKKSGKVYRASSRSYKDLVEMHEAREAGRSLAELGEQHFYVFDTTAYVSRKVPVSMEIYPIWYL